MKRLLCIVGGMNAGGAETFLMKVYRNLDKTRIQMDFAVGIKERGYYDEEIVSLGGKIFHITPKSEGLIKNYVSIKKLVENNRYEYVLRISQHSLSALELLAARHGGAKVLAFRSSNTSTTTASLKELTLHRICLFMPSLFANVKIAPSTEAGIYMFGKNSIKKGKVKLLHNGVDLSQFHFDKKDRDHIRREFGIQDKYVIGHIGRFSKQKNHAFLIDIFKEISEQRSDAVLMLVGAGELEEEIKRKVNVYGLKNRVIFTGLRNDVNKVLCAMDVFVFPSFYEGMPNTVIEAQATGLKCIISDTITKEVNITGQVEFLSINESPKRWAAQVLNSSVKRIDTKECFIKNKYDIESVTDEFVCILKL